MKRILSLVALCSLFFGTALRTQPAAAASGDIALPMCAGEPEVQPKDIVLACGDGNTAIEGVTWHGWGTSIAYGDGTYSYNDCTPACVSGHVHSVHGVIVVWGKQHCGLRSVYARMLIVAPNDADPRSFPAPSCVGR